MIKINVKDNKYLTYDRGSFDDWCVYEIDENGIKKAPLDLEYFLEIKKIANFFEPDLIYEDFIKLYEETTSIFDEKEIINIENISKHYVDYADDIFRVFCILYMGMIAEENKIFTKLGKRIKRLGMYNLLIKQHSPEYCANFMKGMTWEEIDKLCEEGGF